MNLVEPDPSIASQAPRDGNGDILGSALGMTYSDAGEPILRKTRRTSIERYALSIVVGVIAAALAVAARVQLGWPPEVLPTLLLVIAVCLVTVSSGLLGGLTTMITGGLLTWYLIISPNHTWQFDTRGELALLGYFAVTTVILATALLYRASEQRRQSVALEMAMQEARHQWLFAREMAHRLKNALSIVQSIAGQTFGRDKPEVVKFEGRLRALADAHNLLNEHVKQPTASITEVVETAIRPFDDSTERFRANGPPSPLGDQQVVSLSLALHELGTNAVKYGALKHASGWVSIDWAPADGGFQLVWKEHDGPAVKAPKSTGFGSRLLARAAMGTTMDFEPDGLKCTIRLRS